MFFYNLAKIIWRSVKKCAKLSPNNFYSFGDNSTVDISFTQLTGIDKVSIGGDTTILSGARLCVYGESNNGPSIDIGDRCYLGFSISILCLATTKIKIGNDVLFASNVLITSENHGINPEDQLQYMSQPLTGGDIEIGDGCWVGEKVCILPGVKIGRKCIIGAASVVTKSIPDYCIVVGNPAKVIKKYNFKLHSWESVIDE